jgi:hypothetical protein
MRHDGWQCPSLACLRILFSPFCRTQWHLEVLLAGEEETMDLASDQYDPSIGEYGSDRSPRNTPWQIWLVVVFLVVEGVLGNLPLISHYPVAAIWFAAKCLFIVGLLKGWRWVFVLFLLSGVIHVLAFSVQAPFIAFLNLVLVLLTASTFSFYFPKLRSANNDQPQSPPSVDHPGG